MIESPSADTLAAIGTNFKISGVDVDAAEALAGAPPSDWKEVAEKTVVAEAEETRVVKKARTDISPCV